jgi:hypothetical protein
LEEVTIELEDIVMALVGVDINLGSFQMVKEELIVRIIGLGISLAWDLVEIFKRIVDGLPMDQGAHLCDLLLGHLCFIGNVYFNLSLCLDYIDFIAFVHEVLIPLDSFLVVSFEEDRS